MQAFADDIGHGLVAIAVRVYIVSRGFIGMAFEFLDGTPGGQVHNGPGTREIQVAAPIDQRRACRTHMQFF